MNTTIYINIDERYGEQVEATLSDYLELNPEGKFVQTDDNIAEWLSPTARAPIVIAVSKEAFGEMTTA